MSKRVVSVRLVGLDDFVEVSPGRFVSRAEVERVESIYGRSLSGKEILSFFERELALSRLRVSRKGTWPGKVEDEKVGRV